MVIKLSNPPITDKEKQPTPFQAVGMGDMEMFRNPDLSSILNELLNTDEDKIAISTNIDKKRTLNTMVSMETYAENTLDLFRNLNPNDPDAKEILNLVRGDADKIRHQIKVKLMRHKAYKGYTTNKIIEAIAARLSRIDRAKSMLTRGQQAGDSKEAL